MHDAAVCDAICMQLKREVEELWGSIRDSRTGTTPLRYESLAGSMQRLGPVHAPLHSCNLICPCMQLLCPLHSHCGVIVL